MIGYRQQPAPLLSPGAGSDWNRGPMAQPAAAPAIRAEIPGSLIVATEALAVAQEHVAWARGQGMTPVAVGAAVLRRTASWDEAAGALALAWQEWCAATEGEERWRN